MAIVFECIDLSCQATDLSFFPPQVKLSCVSQSKFITWYGYSEFVPSTPPKKYKKITFTGESKRVAFTAEETPRQCGGAKYVYSGDGTIDVKGNQLTYYAKGFYAQCSKQFWPLEPLQTVDGAITTGGQFPQFVGYCWPDDPASCPTCDPDDNNWSFLGNFSTNNPLVDLGAFMRGVNDPVVTATTWSLNDVFYGLTSISRNGPYTFTSTGAGWDVAVGGTVYKAQGVITDPTSLTFPVESISGVVGEYINFTDTNNYSATLSDEYTDAEALSNAKFVSGTGATAQNFPRTTGFTTVITSVNYTLSCSNLIVDQAYRVTVDLWDKNPLTGINTHTPKNYDFTATDTTHVINDTIATPADGHTTTVRLATIAIQP